MPQGPGTYGSKRGRPAKGELLEYETVWSFTATYEHDEDAARDQHVRRWASFAPSLWTAVSTCDLVVFLVAACPAACVRRVRDKSVA